MRVICDGVPQVAKSKRLHRGTVYFQLDDGRLIPGDKCQSIPDFKPGDIIRLVNPNCWEWKRWPGGVTAKVVDVLDGGARLRISTPESERGGFYYGVDAENWAIVETPAPPPSNGVPMADVEVAQ